MAKIRQEQQEVVDGLPDYMKKLIEGWKPTHCGFEIVECVRKIAIVGAPVFFDPAGSAAQLIFGLMISFITVAVYAHAQPYAKPSDNTLALLCQGQIFFALLSALSLNVNFDSGGSTDAIDALLSFITFVPIVLALALGFTPAERLFDPAERAKIKFFRPLKRTVVEDEVHV